MIAMALFGLITMGAVEKPMLIGGQPYDADRASNLARLDGSLGPCSGLLIAPGWVLTAAHCEEAAVEVRVGVLEFDPESDYHEVIEWHAHPSWDSSLMTGDLALVKIHPPIWGKPIVRFGKTKPPLGPTSNTYGGWGEHEFTGGYPILEVPFPKWGQLDEIVDCDVARPGEPLLGGDGPSICAVDYEGDSCNGDSGSAMWGEDGLVYGIVVLGVRGCPAGANKLFTDLTDPGYQKWIRETIAGDIVANFEWPNSTVSSISIAGGWAFSEGSNIINLVELWINGEYSISMPCCSDRGDVKKVFPSADLLSGFAGIYNWPKLLPDGVSTLEALVYNELGDKLVLEKQVYINRLEN